VRGAEKTEVDQLTLLTLKETFVVEALCQFLFQFCFTYADSFRTEEVSSTADIFVAYSHKFATWRIQDEYINIPLCQFKNRYG